MRILAAAGALTLTCLSAIPAGAHEAEQVQYELRQRGYYDVRVLVAEPPRFQVNACRGGERFHLHVDFYGRVTERTPIGPCHRLWRQAYGQRYRPY